MVGIGYYGYGFYGMDPFYIVLVVASLVLGLATQAYIKHAYAKWSAVPASIPGTGAEVARRMLNEGGAGNIAIDRIGGELTDNFNPQDACLHLSEENFSGASVASVAVACHEAGHAVQAAKGFSMYRLRTSLVPVVSLASNFWWLVLMLGIFMNVAGLVTAAIWLFAATVVFSLVTLPVEIDASRRAVAYLRTYGAGVDEKGAKQVLTAAALTYVASALISILQLLYYLSRYGGRNRD
ncbi:zinc metallopeptidase [Paratractidigestivibacter sp.]|uniref:zinc metallopeptidase n=1 Tax=Paratractidigestivibacter sp. TaxID=2847316 RepID=UPI002ABDFEFF|nr:zinc metallopeptidase [Paratractidigestivibacter sp.]